MSGCNKKLTTTQSVFVTAVKYTECQPSRAPQIVWTSLKRQATSANTPSLPEQPQRNIPRAACSLFSIRAPKPSPSMLGKLRCFKSKRRYHKLATNKEVEVAARIANAQLLAPASAALQSPPRAHRIYALNTKGPSSKSQHGNLLQTYFLLKATFVTFVTFVTFSPHHPLRGQWHPPQSPVAQCRRRKIVLPMGRLVARPLPTVSDR